MWSHHVTYALVPMVNGDDSAQLAGLFGGSGASCTCVAHNTPLPTHSIVGTQDLDADNHFNRKDTLFGHVI